MDEKSKIERHLVVRNENQSHMDQGGSEITLHKTIRSHLLQ